jgi:hypothetical protein
MPLQAKEVDFTTGQPVQIVPAGSRINGLTAIRAPRGLFYGVKLGNNPIVTGYNGRFTMTFTGDEPDQDVFEGVTIFPASPAPNQSAVFQVSFTTG